MTKESIIELQKIDYNCNDCKFMERDMELYKQWDVWRLQYQQYLFGLRKAHALDVAIRLNNEDPQNPAYIEMVWDALEMVFVFEMNKINYGNCLKFTKPVTFMPGTCQIETQGCFEHRRG